MRQIVISYFRGWNYMRLLRLVLGLILLIEAVKKIDWMFGIIGSILFIQAVLNIASCTGGACDVDHVKQRPPSSEKD